MTRRHGLAVTERQPKGWSGPLVVVLVHGSLDRSTSFARVVRRLPDLHTVVYDRRGYHRSRDAVPLHTTFDGHVDDLITVIDGRPTVVVGHSYGGDVAIAAALRPESRSSILAVAAYEPPLPWLAEYRSAPDAAPRDAAADGDPGDPEVAAAAAERFFRRMVGDASWEQLPEQAKAARRADGPALAAELHAIRSIEAPFDVTTMSVPATYGCGENSAARHRRSVAWLLEHTPGAELFEIGGASHGAHLTHPDGFAAMVRSALARASRPAEATP
jgi:pimeloyl-ACP methyl ester carboxylesterase